MKDINSMINFNTHLTQPIMLPWSENLKRTEFYKPKPKYFWWKVLKDLPCCLVNPLNGMKYYSSIPMYDVPSPVVYWVFNNVKNTYYMFFDEEIKQFRFYFTDSNEALWFKLTF